MKKDIGNWEHYDSYHTRGGRLVREDYRKKDKTGYIVIEFRDLKTGWTVETGLLRMRIFHGGTKKEATDFAKAYMRSH